MGGIVLVLAGAVAIAFYLQERDLREDYSFAGLPMSREFSLVLWQRVFRNDGYMVGYSEWRRNPLWVTYRLKLPSTKHARGERSAFQTDWRSLMRVSADDYRHSGFDRGHMAPNYAISVVYGKKAQSETFLMTNISPQTRNLNQKLWQRLEQSVMDDFLPAFKDIWVVTGPVFGTKPDRLDGGIAVPESFYKILLAPTGARGEPTALAFIMPQNVRGNESLERYVSSIDEIERRTGLDFFHRLDDITEARLEASMNPVVWRLSRVANRPARY